MTTYSAILDIPRNTIAYLANLLLRRRQTLGTRAGRRALSVGKQAILILRWFLERRTCTPRWKRPSKPDTPTSTSTAP